MTKLTIAATLLCAGSLWAQSITIPTHPSKLLKAERITVDEKAALDKATVAVQQAQDELQAVQNRIATAHKITWESYPEWSSWYEIDGDFILQRFQSHQENRIGW